MTFIISSKGVNNTKGTIAKFGAGGKMKVAGNFQNTGDVEVDIRANLEILGNLINSGKFSIKDYVAENRYKIIEDTLNDLQGEAKDYLQFSYDNLKLGEIEKANSHFHKFISYLKEHPELITSSVQILLQMFGLKYIYE